MHDLPSGLDLVRPAETAATWEPIDSLTAWERNPRHNEEAIGPVAESIRRYGFGAPVVARAADRRVIAGHTRIEAARRLGLSEVPVRFLDLDEEQAVGLSLADNKLGELATWDEPQLADLLGGLDELPPGWDDEGFADLVTRTLGDAPPASDDAPPVEQGEPDSVLGGVYELGPHRLVCGDCRKLAVVALLMGGRKINVAFTSPPYASQRKYDESSGFSPIPPDEYVVWFDAVQANVREHLADDGSWFVNIKEHCEDGQRSLYVKDLTIAHVRAWGWLLVDEFAWTRAGVPGTWPNRFKNGWEPVFHFSARGDLKFRPANVLTKTEYAFDYSPRNRRNGSGSGLLGKRDGFRDGMARPGNVVAIRSGGLSVTGEHSAEFPTGLPDFFIRAFSDEGDAIFDPFLGSGTTLIAAAQSKRIAFGCEISPRYCDVIRRRYGVWARAAGLDPGPGALALAR